MVDEFVVNNVRDYILAGFADFGLHYDIDVTFERPEWICVRNDVDCSRAFDIYFGPNYIWVYSFKHIWVSYDSFGDIYEFMGLMLSHNYLGFYD